MTDRISQFEQDLRRAYSTLGEVTSRLLLVNEAADAVFGTYDRTELSQKFLDVVARACEARRAALFLHDGGSLLLGATRGLSEAERAALLESAQAVAWCDQALESNTAVVVDPAMAPASLVAAAEDDVEVVEKEPAQAGEEPQVPGGSEAAGDSVSPGAPADSGAAEEASETDHTDPAWEFGIYLPAVIEDQPAAVLALGARARGAPYSEEDITFLRHLLGQLAVAVSRIVLSERNQQRLAELDALLRVSREITSTLDADAVMRGVVNTAGAVVENDRCWLALMDGGKLRLRAMSGLTRVSGEMVESYKLTEVLEWLALSPQPLQIAAEDLMKDGDRPGSDVFRRYFELQVMSAFMALPLKDDQGLLGFLCVESKQPSWDLETGKSDALEVLAAQTTVAVRNALLYSQIPMRKMAAPLAGARVLLGRLSPERRRLVAVGAVVALVIALVPWLPRRAGGPCEVMPLRSYTLRAETEGVVREVMAQGGESVVAGQVIAVLEDPDLSARVSELSGRLQGARVEASRAQQRGDALEYRLKQLEAEDLGRRLALEEERRSRTRLTAPASGQILETNLAEQVGRHLAAGDAFCRVTDLSRMRAEILIGEEQIAWVEVGAPVQLKVLSFPTRAFRGRVAEVAWAADPASGRRPAYRVRVEVPNPDRVLRPGMTGQAKVSTGRHSPLGMLAEPFLRQARLTFW